MDKEKELRPIINFPGYFVNDLGEVWSKKKFGYSEKGTLRKIKITVNVRGYLTVSLWKDNKGHTKMVSRLVIDAPSNKFVDHINGDRTKNKKGNLRLCNNSENKMNGWAHRDGTSKYKGVSWVEDRKKWVAQICKNYKQRSLGRYKTEIEAARAYNTEAKKLFGEFARTNNI